MVESHQIVGWAVEQAMVQTLEHSLSHDLNTGLKDMSSDGQMYCLCYPLCHTKTRLKVLYTGRQCSLISGILKVQFLLKKFTGNLQSSDDIIVFCWLIDL